MNKPPAEPEFTPILTYSLGTSNGIRAIKVHNETGHVSIFTADNNISVLMEHLTKLVLLQKSIYNSEKT